MLAFGPKKFEFKTKYMATLKFRILEHYQGESVYNDFSL